MLQWFLIILGGTTHGSLNDPLVWVMMSIGFVLGLLRAGWPMIGGACIAVAATRAYVSVSNRASMGFEQDYFFTSMGALAGVLLFLAAWLAGYLAVQIATARSRARNP